MAAGSYDRIIVIQHATEKQDSTGENVLSWVDYLTRWAEVRHMFGRELTAAQQLAANVDTQFLLRYDDQIKTVTPDQTFRIRFEDSLYDVKYSKEDTTTQRRRSGWRILARARAEAA